MSDSSEPNVHFLDYWSIIKFRWPIILIIFVLVTSVAGVTCYFLPREYFSRAVVEVKPDDTTLKIFNSEIGIKGSREVGLSQSSIQIFLSKKVLYPVIENLNLQETWGKGRFLTKEEAYYMLRRKMNDTKEIRLTEMIQIGVYSTDPVEAANIANGVVKVYQEQRRATQQNLMREGLRQLEDALQEKLVTVQSARAKMQEIRDRDGIVDLHPETNETTVTPEGTTVQADEQQVNELKIRVTELRSQLAQIEKLKADELIAALHHLNIDDPTVAKVLPLYQDATAEEARMLNSGLGSKHPRVKALQAQKSVYEEQLHEQIGALRSTLDTRLKVAESTLEALTEKKQGARDDYAQMRTKSGDYLAAKEAYLQAKRLYEAADSAFDMRKMQSVMSIYPAEVWEEAEPSRIPARPQVLLYMSLAVVGGAILGVSLAFFLEYLDTSVKTVDDVETMLNIPVLGVIPSGVGSLLAQAGDTPDAEAYRILQTNLDMNRKDAGASTITLVSGGVGEGKSTTLNNLAYTYARAGFSVLVIDADLRRCSQHTFFGCDRAVGLADILSGSVRVEDAVRSTSVPTLWFIPAGQLTADMRGVVNAHQLAELIEEVKPHYDFVFFDSPPILGLSDAAVLTSLVDITLMVIQYRRFPRAMLERVKLSVLQARGNLVGAVLNNVDARRDENYQYYTQYYSYYDQRPQKGGKRKASPAAAATSGAGSEEY